ncbi:MAG TPA: fibronectin type III domain-containing protein [archaeon]|nr:fibronectin type III domain-containing protein [archaeon]
MRVAFVIALSLIFSLTTVYADTGADGTWCNDSDYAGGNYVGTSGSCQDASGTYTDYCEGDTAKDYYCTGTWNGTASSNVHCAAGGYVCSSPYTCSNGACVQSTPDPCAGVTCNTPPSAVCDGSNLRIYSSSGTCGSGTCSYPYNTTSCPNGCSIGACVQNATVSYYGACIIRDSYTNLPSYDAPSVGQGYAKYNLGTVTSYEDAKSRCIDSIYTTPMSNYCSSNSNTVQWQVAIYTYSNGAYNYQTTGCANSGCDYRACAATNTTSSNPTGGSPPPAPASYGVSVYGTNSASMSWVDVSGETIYLIYREPSGSSRTLVANLTSNTSSYIDNNLPNGQYSYYISACNPYGCSSQLNMGGTIGISGSGNTAEANTSTTSSPNCVDTDNGQNYNQRGTVTYNLNYDAAYRYTLNDICSGNTLNEYYCSGDTAQTGYYSCPNGCSEGACKTGECTNGQTQTATCTDGRTYTKSNCLEGKWVSVNYLVDPCNNFNTPPMYRYAKWTCGANYTTVQGSESSCKDEDTWRKYAEANCIGRGVTSFYPDARCDNTQCVSVACASPPAGCYYADATWQNGCQKDCGRIVCNQCNNNGVCERGEENNCKDCIGGECPLTTKCADGSVKACYKAGSVCNCEPCPVPASTLPTGCRQEMDPSGFIRVICDNYKATCPVIDRASTAKCSANGGYPSIKRDANGCDHFYCDFGNQGAPPSLFANTECPASDSAAATLQKCDSLGMKSVVAFENGCKIAKCIQQGNECPAIGGREDAAQKCLANNQVVTVAYGNDGCQYLKCEQQGYCQQDLPKEAYSKCADKGGQLIVNRDGNGCVSQSQCVGRGDTKNTYVENVNSVPDSSELLSIAFKLENLRVQFDGLGEKSADIADYYRTTGSTEEKRFRRVSDMFYAARDRVDEIKTKIRQKLDTLTLDDVTEIKSDIRYIKDVIIKDVLYVMLGSGDDIDKLKNGTKDNCGSDDRCFNDALRICQPMTFLPKDGFVVNINGLEGTKCIITARLGNDDMTCGIEKYSLGIKNPETDIFPYCTGSLLGIMKTMSNEKSQPTVASQPAIRRETAVQATIPQTTETSTASSGGGGGGGESCSGCLNNGVCDPGECSYCADCG